MMDDDLENHQSAVVGDHGELFPKLKMKNQQLVGVDQNQNQHPDGLSICQFCNKEFRSSKALGGHLRIHYQSHPELIKKSAHPTKKPKREDIISLADIAKKINISKRNKATGTVPTCFICSKTFPSMKSLFGHMRCHPDRDWRGIHPPPAINKATTSCSSSSSLSMALSDVVPPDQDDNNNDNDRVSNFSAAPVDLTESLFGWSATAKRGRKLQTSSDFDREIWAAHELIRLANGDGGDLFHESRSSPSPTLTPTSKQTVVEATNSNSLAYKAEDESEDKKKKKKKKRSFQELSAGYIKEGHHPVKQLSFRPVDDRKPENMDAHHDDESGKSVSSRSQWEDTSNWAYEEGESASRNTEQQLNGNGNGKGNGKVIIIKNNIKKKRKKIKDLESVQNASPDTVHVHQVVPATTTPDKYRCGTCNKSFPTYQALGGHRSVHNKLIRRTIHNFVVEEEGLADSLVFEDEENKVSEEGAGSSKQVDDETTATTTTIIHKCSTKFWTVHHAPVAVAPSRQEVSTSVGELSHTCGGGGGGGRGLDFDLNEAPPAEEDDDDGGGGGGGGGGLKCDEHDVCGHASSSFNSVEFPVFESSSSGL